MSVGGPGWAPQDIDPTKPSVARVYDYYLGGSHNFESDRAFGRQALGAFPGLSQILRDNRAFLRRVVLFLVAAGVDQFLDLGSGIPTVGNVHEVAQAANPLARIVYVDHDPVAVLFIAVLPFIDDAERPAELVGRYMTAAARGSYLAVSHPLRVARSAALDLTRVYEQPRSPNALRFRSGEQIEALFGDLTVVDPGVVLMPLWRPEPTDDGQAPQVGPDYPGLAGLGRRD